MRVIIFRICSNPFFCLFIYFSVRSKHVWKMLGVVPGNQSNSWTSQNLADSSKLRKVIPESYRNRYQHFRIDDLSQKVTIFAHISLIPWFGIPYSNEKGEDISSPEDGVSGSYGKVWESHSAYLRRTRRPKLGFRERTEARRTMWIGLGLDAGIREKPGRRKR